MRKKEKRKKNEKKEKQKERKDDRAHLAPIAKPLAGKRLTKKILKLTTKAAKQKRIRRGVKEVVKAIKKGEKGLGILAGDISPIDVLSHIPILCEESDITYCYVPSKEDLGAASQTKRPTSCVLIWINEQDEFKDLYGDVKSGIQELEIHFGGPCCL